LTRSRSAAGEVTLRRAAVGFLCSDVLMLYLRKISITLSGKG
jgi:hypothetical protein